MAPETLTVEPSPAGPNEEIIVAGTNYKPGETLGIQLAHSESDAPRRRDAVVGLDGKFTLSSRSHVAGTIVIGVYRPPKAEAVEAAGRHPRKAVRDLVAQIELTVEGGEASNDDVGDKDSNEDGS